MPRLVRRAFGGSRRVDERGREGAPRPRRRCSRPAPVVGSRELPAGPSAAWWTVPFGLYMERRTTSPADKITER
jgi:hypothetical protein